MVGTANEYGRLLGIAIKNHPGSPMRVVPAATVSERDGIVAEKRSYKPHRLITVISREAWLAACAEAGTDLPWTARRANLLIEGIDLNATTGAHLKIGELVLEVTGETKPCSRMDEAFHGLQDALTPSWRGGITCKVVQGGNISVGALVQMAPPLQEP